MCPFRYMENTRNTLQVLHRVDTFRILAGAGQVNGKGGDFIAADSGGMADGVPGEVGRASASSAWFWCDQWAEACRAPTPWTVTQGSRLEGAPVT
jgi:hypothetical protein